MHTKLSSANRIINPYKILYTKKKSSTLQTDMEAAYINTEKTNIEQTDYKISTGFQVSMKK